MPEQKSMAVPLRFIELNVAGMVEPKSTKVPDREVRLA